MIVIDSNTEQRLIQLRNKIELNNANLDDYKEYETLLINTGKYSHEDIHNRLIKFGYDSWKDYYKSRQLRVFNDRKIIDKSTEGAVLGSILGLALAAIVSSKLASVSK